MWSIIGLAVVALLGAWFGYKAVYGFYLIVLHDRHVDRCPQCRRGHAFNRRALTDPFATRRAFEYLCPRGRLSVLRYHEFRGLVDRGVAMRARALYELQLEDAIVKGEIPEVEP